mmetsp:Transcript_84101/g.233058  ORF Transcript_84101/g.233058 Transcript_84101/m.233058 type:complete len:218 (-) Transcript_84101:1350-2003(-)
MRPHTPCDVTPATVRWVATALPLTLPSAKSTSPHDSCTSPASTIGVAACSWTISRKRARSAETEFQLSLYHGAPTLHAMALPRANDMVAIKSSSHAASASRLLVFVIEGRTVRRSGGTCGFIGVPVAYTCHGLPAALDSANFSRMKPSASSPICLRVGSHRSRVAASSSASAASNASGESICDELVYASLVALIQTEPRPDEGLPSECSPGALPPEP